MPVSYTHLDVYKRQGTTYVPTQTYTDKTVLYIFGAGKGYVATEENSYNINNELCFYVADLDNGKYAIHAVTDMEFMHLVVDMNEYDLKIYSEFHYKLPYFRALSPVSYTHLDVYKRQPPHLGQGGRERINCP